MRNPFSTEIPPTERQVSYWDGWNVEARLGELDFYCECIRDEALRHARQMPAGSRFLELGCGTGWLSAALAEVGETVGVDFSPKAIEAAVARRSAARFVCGDFAEVSLTGPFDLVVTADSIAHVPDQRAFLDRCAELMRPGGRLVVMTQNGFVLKRSSWVPPPAPGQIRRWPTVRELRQLLDRRFDILEVSTVAPLGGNMGFMKWVNSGAVWGVLRRTLGRERTLRLFCRLRLGREIVVVATRRA